QAEGIVDVHQSWAEVPPSLGLDIVCHQDTTAGAIWPEPYKRDALYPKSRYRKQHHPLANIFHRRVHRPVRKSQLAPIPGLGSLNGPSRSLRQPGAHSVVDILREHTDAGVGI